MDCGRLPYQNSLAPLHQCSTVKTRGVAKGCGLTVIINGHVGAGGLLDAVVV